MQRGRGAGEVKGYRGGVEEQEKRAVSVIWGSSSRGISEGPGVPRTKQELQGSQATDVVGPDNI